mmetsp:Transcript_2539/g.3907  ORF Transcript_2539/g.3907 Transcript_2539/m.3907 type:complete len:129 (-) Transcript_2539:385-771(-)
MDTSSLTGTCSKWINRRQSALSCSPLVGWALGHAAKSCKGIWDAGGKGRRGEAEKGLVSSNKSIVAGLVWSGLGETIFRFVYRWVQFPRALQGLHAAGYLYRNVPHVHLTDNTQDETMPKRDACLWRR